MDNFDQVREVTKSILEGAGYTTVAVSNIGDALKALGKKIPDLIISEIELPGIGGVGFYNRLKKNDGCQGIPFIFLTNYDAKKIQPKIQKYQDIVIAKSSPWREILSKLENFIQARQDTPKASGAKGTKTSQLPIAKKEEDTKKDLKKKSVSKPLDKGVAQSRQPKEIDIQPSSESTKGKKKKKRPNVQNQVSPGLSTQHFSIPSSFFDAKKIGNLFSTLFYACKKGNWEELKKYEFSPLVVSTEEIRAKLKEKSSYLAKKEESLFQEMEIEEASEYLLKETGNRKAQYLIEDEDILVELSDDLNDIDLSQDEMVAKKETDRIPYTPQAQAAQEELLLDNSADSEAEENPYSINKDQEETSRILIDSAQREAMLRQQPISTEKITQKDTEETPEELAKRAQEETDKMPSVTMQEFGLQTESIKAKETGIFLAEDQKIPNITEEKIEEIAHNLFSMAGLCLQMFSLEFAVESLCLETKGKNIEFFPKEETYFYKIFPNMDKPESK